MSTQFIKSTFGAEAITKIGVFGSSITGGYSFDERWESYVHTTVNYLKLHGMYIDVIDYSINSGTLYNARHSSYVIPAYVSGGRPPRDGSGRTLDQAILDGITHAFIFLDNNDTATGNIDANPSGLNVVGEEQIDLFQNFIDVCVANSIVPIVATNNTNLTDTFPIATYKLVSDNMKTVWDSAGQAYLDIFYTLANPANDYKGFPVDFFDNVHWNLDDGSDIGHGKMKNALIALLNEQFVLTQEVYELLSDTPCAGNNLVTNNNIAVTNNGEFVINTP